MYAIIKYTLMVHTTNTCDLLDYNEATEDNSPLHSELIEVRDSVSELIMEMIEETGRYTYIPGAFSILPEGMPHSGTLILSEIFKTENSIISGKELKKIEKNIENKLSNFNNGYSDGHIMDIKGKILKGLYDDKAVNESFAYAYTIQNELKNAEAKTYYLQRAELQPTPEQEKELNAYFDAHVPDYDKSLIISTCIRYTAIDEDRGNSTNPEMLGYGMLVFINQKWKSMMKEEFLDSENLHYIPAIFSMPTQNTDDKFSYSCTFIDIIMGTKNISSKEMEKTINRRYRKVRRTFADELVFPAQISFPNVTIGKIDNTTPSSLMKSIEELRTEKYDTVEEFSFES